MPKKTRPEFHNHMWQLMAQFMEGKEDEGYHKDEVRNRIAHDVSARPEFYQIDTTVAALAYFEKLWVKFHDSADEEQPLLPGITVRERAYTQRDIHVRGQHRHVHWKFATYLHGLEHFDIGQAKGQEAVDRCKLGRVEIIARMKQNGGNANARIYTEAPALVDA